jgi:di/tricarboxylate transporter
LRIVTPGEARRSIDLDVVLLIAGGIGLSSAITSSGLAEELASLLVSGLDTFGSVGTLVGIVIATVMLTEVISNVAAASIVFPISVAAAASLGSDPRGFAIAIAIAASASFLTPIGYQTNVMVYGPGGYRYGDYSRLGAPLTAVVLVALTVGVPLFWGV